MGLIDSTNNHEDIFGPVLNDLMFKWIYAFKGEYKGKTRVRGFFFLIQIGGLLAGSLCVYL